jgi:hypothetical protein
MMFPKKVFQPLTGLALAACVFQSCNHSENTGITTIGKIEIKADDNPLRKFDFILIKDSSKVIKPSKGYGPLDCSSGLVTYCRLGLINHVREIYFLDYSCSEHYGVSTTTSSATILPQLFQCNASWPLQRTLKLGDTLFTNFRVCSQKNAPVQFEWILPLFEKKAEGEPYFSGAVKRNEDEVYDTLKLTSKTFYL